VLGVNVDDLSDHRPGQRAATVAGAVFPLVTAGFTKADVRAASRRLGLRTWDKPAAACLASRVPYGTEVSVVVLSRVERAEAALHALGLGQVRVRHYRDTARIEVEVDDLADHRPGQRAAVDAGASFPLVTAGFTKFDVREASRHLGLRTWDKPAAACLASRVPYGTEVNVAVLSRVERAEAALRALGFAQVRVRHYGDTARVELELTELPRAIEQRERIVNGVRGAGYRYVTLDLEGFRSGNLNS